MNLTFLIVVVALIAMFVILLRAIIGTEKSDQLRSKITGSSPSQSGATPATSGAERPGK